MLRIFACTCFVGMKQVSRVSFVWLLNVYRIV